MGTGFVNGAGGGDKKAIASNYLFRYSLSINLNKNGFYVFSGIDAVGYSSWPDIPENYRLDGGVVDGELSVLYNAGNRINVSYDNQTGVLQFSSANSTQAPFTLWCIE